MARGRIDAMIQNEFVANSSVKLLSLDGQVKVSDVTVQDDFEYVMFSKKSVTPKEVEAFNTALQRVKDNGTFEAILAKYR